MKTALNTLIEDNPHLDIKNLILDTELLNYPIQDNKDPIVKVKTKGKLKVNIYSDSRLALHLPKEICYLRKTVSEKLIQGAESLPENYSLVVIDAYRDSNIQKKQFQRCYSEMIKKYGNTKKAFEEASLFVAPIEIAPHCTGGAVDIYLAYKGKKLNFGSEYATRKKTSYSANLEFDKKILENRFILYKTMLKHGFVNYPSEWWHWSYGDTYWGSVNDVPAKYDKVELQ